MNGEVIITRRLFKTGESVYLLNGRTCWLRDIQELFLASGLGPDTYAIIGQEQIGQLLSSKPNDRQAVIEAAAGISGLKAQRRQADAQLANARENLARVDDIFDEVSRQVVSLKRQAAKAERIAGVRNELREKLQIAIASRMAILGAELVRLESEIAALSTAISDASARVEAIEESRRSLADRGHKLEQKGQEALSQANTAIVELERAIVEQNDNAERLKELEGQLESMGRELEQAQKELNGAIAEREQQRADLAMLREQLNELRRGLGGRKQEECKAADAVLNAERQLEMGRNVASQLLMAAIDACNQSFQTEESLGMLERAAERIVLETGQTQEELTRLNSDKENARQQYEVTRERFLQKDRDLMGTSEALQTARTKEAAVREQCNTLRFDHALALARRQGLDALFREHSYATDVVQCLLSPGALGGNVSPIRTLADFLEVSGAYEQIVDEFLRDELNYVVVDSWTTAEAAVSLLKSRIDGRATFLIHSLSGSDECGNAGDDKPLSCTAGVTPLNHEIRVLNGFGASLEAAIPKLRYGYIVDSSANALRLAAEFPDAFFLTPQGECFHNSTVTGGMPASHGPLSLKRERQEIEVHLAVLENELEQARAENAALDSAIQELSEEAQIRSDDLHRLGLDLANHEAALKQAEAAVARAERRLDELKLQASRNAGAYAAKQSLVSETCKEAARLEAEQKAAEAAIDDYQDEVTALRRRQERLQVEVSDASVEVARIDERRQIAEGVLQHSDARCTHLAGRISSGADQRIAAEAELARRLHEADALTEKVQTLKARHAEASSEKEKASTEVHALRQLISGVEADLRAERATIMRLQDDRAARSQQTAKLRADMEHCAARSLAELGIEAETLRVNETISRLTGDELTLLEEECRALRRRIEQMGPENTMALEEYQEANARYGLLEMQRKDLLESISSTQAAIKEIDHESRGKFDEALGRINENFDKVFGELFHGGHALLRPIDQESYGEGGLEIVASPPGKRLQNVQLLSGGEKALTALALLVAVFQYRPSPFCVLDEIDAPLDEANISRFAELMRSLGRDTQFVVVTHSRLMMQSADVIFGITMQEPGISKMLSLRLDRP